MNTNVKQMFISILTLGLAGGVVVESLLSTPTGTASTITTQATKELVTPTSTVTAAPTVPTTNAPVPVVTTKTPAPITHTSPYADGTYNATSEYGTPESIESIGLTVTIKNGVVTDSSVALSGSEGRSRRYQSAFADGYKQFVIGKDISTLSLSRVSGASLTSMGFNAALAQIKSQAQA